MGRGNACVKGDYEGLYYIAWDQFQTTDEEGNIIEDYGLQQDLLDDFLEKFKIAFKEKYKSFDNCNKWISRTEKSILENGLFYIVTEDNEWSIAIKLLQKEQDYYSKGTITNLQAGLYKVYLEGIKKFLLYQFNEIWTYSGPWTSSKITA